MGNLRRTIGSRTAIFSGAALIGFATLLVCAALIGVTALLGGRVFRGLFPGAAPIDTPTLMVPTEVTPSPAASSTPVSTVAVTPTQLITFSSKSTVVMLKTGPDPKFPNASPAYPKNTQFVVLSRYGNWFYVRAPDGVEGWADNVWLNVIGDTAAIPEASNVPLVPPTAVHKEKDQNKKYP